MSVEYCVKVEIKATIDGFIRTRLESVQINQEQIWYRLTTQLQEMIETSLAGYYMGPSRCLDDDYNLCN